VEAVGSNTRGVKSGVVVACSALKASYREVLRGERANLDPETCPRGGSSGEAVAAVSGERSEKRLPVEEERRLEGRTEERPAGGSLARARAPPATFFVHPFGARSVLLERMMRRESHFMKANMLTSQLEALENPGEIGEKGVVEIRLEGEVAEQVLAAVEGLREVLPYM
jgi:gluconokinase